MNHQKTVNAFKAFANKYRECMTSNNSDVFVYPHIPTEVIGSVRGNFNISPKETILYVRDTSFQNERNQGTVVTDRGMHYLPDKEIEDERFLPWHGVRNVTFCADGFHFYGYNENERHLVIERKSILKEKPDALFRDIQTGAAIVKESSDDLLRSAAIIKENYDRILYEDYESIFMKENCRDLLFAGYTIGRTAGSVIGFFQSRMDQKRGQVALFCELFRCLAATQRAEYVAYSNEEYSENPYAAYNKRLLMENL